MSIADKIVAANRAPSSLRLGVVTGLATLLVGLFIYPIEKPTYIVTTTISRPRTDHDKSGGLDEDARNLLSDAYIERVRGMRLLVASNGSLRDNVQVHAKSLAPFRVSYDVSVKQVGDAQAKHAAQQFVTDLIEYQNHRTHRPTSHTPHLSGDQVAAAKKNEQAAKDGLIRFVQQEIPQWLENRAKEISAAPQRSSGQENKAEPPPRPIASKVNPRWQFLRKQIDRVATQLEELRQTKTDQHPNYRFTVLKMSELQRRLAATPRYRDDDTDPLPHRKRAVVNGSPKTRKTTDAVSASSQLASKINDHILKLEKAQTTLRKHEAEQMKESLAGAAGQTWVVAGKPRVRRMAAKVPLQFLLLLGGASVGVGLFFAASTTGLGEARFFEANEVRSAIPAPIVSVIPSVTGKRARRSNRLALLKGIQRTSEALLIVSAVCFLGVCLTGSERINEFSYDPIGVVVQVLRM